MVLYLFNSIWVAPTTITLFGHLIFTNFQHKILFLFFFNLLLIMLVFLSNFYFSSRELFDFLIVFINCFYFLFLLFCSNTIFTSIFIIEVISTCIFLLIISSTVSTAFFYNNLNFSFGSVFQSATPFYHLQSILYFFWVSLISALSLFFFLIYIYLKLLTLDWFILEYIFYYVCNSSSISQILSIGVVWFVFIFCFFLKCGLAPLHLWKPTFFKGLPFYTLFVYICFYYFSVFLFFLYLFNTYLSDIFFFFVYISLFLVFVGLLALLSIVCEATYIKSFLAISSIINSLLVCLALMSSHLTGVTFNLL